ncbi:RagB/SusD family nutrient uptake outer membrane protein [Dawidia soli]|uniref:RagB/SusD family nutrient uptake outer membrane protein n=1 Tax=Dawidia soli TaxID=2782352 RepID=A0AAP2GDT4_9BACT|nr:RagB/SusD family nutrient uptake outer membrane protein [Dawidia soli]MBT1687664.1 RagB/SusD family nutrient uptake outer membrane protein [Dawidia soli]
MKTTFIKNIAFTATLAMGVLGCTDDLDQVPRYEDTSANIYKDFGNYKSILAKAYSGLALTGSQGPEGNPDIKGGNEGFSSYLRQYWQLQELPTDEAVISWTDAGLPNLHFMDWTSTNQFVEALYYRIFYQVAICNEFIRETTDGKLSERGITGANLEEAKHYRAEARFLRALSYWHALDLYGSVPFVTETDEVGSFFPKQISRADLFAYLESELTAIEAELVPARQNEYARADQAAAWTLLAKLYLNAEVYTGEAHYTEAITYTKKVIDAGYTLEEDFEHNFLADNDQSTEVIFPVASDGQRIQSYGGMNYILKGPIPRGKNVEYGIDAGWSGPRATRNIVDLFPPIGSGIDEREMFFTEGYTLEINSVSSETDGYPIIKFKNITSTGEPGSHTTFVDTDYPMFRLADVYLMYAEAVLRNGQGGSRAEALGYVNDLRERAYNNTSGNITDGQLTLDFIIDERARELASEAVRRTDLIRFGRFTEGTYLWPWKGGLKEGRGVESYRKLYPIPQSDLIANPNLDPKVNGY